MWREAEGIIAAVKWNPR